MYELATNQISPLCHVVAFALKHNRIAFNSFHDAGEEKEAVASALRHFGTVLWMSPQYYWKSGAVFQPPDDFDPLGILLSSYRKIDISFASLIFEPSLVDELHKLRPYLYLLHSFSDAVSPLTFHGVG